MTMVFGIAALALAILAIFVLTAGISAIAILLAILCLIIAIVIATKECGTSKKWFIRLGALCLIVSVVWWYLFFQLALMPRPDTPAQGWVLRSLVCLVYTSNPCLAVATIAEQKFGMGYYPFLTWAGLALLFVAAIIRNGHAVTNFRS